MNMIHFYVSTYCVHGDHDHCRLACKICEAMCLCPCHEEKPKREQGEGI